MKLPKYLSKRQFKGLQKLGDAYIPGDKELPRFSECGCAEHADRILDPMPAADRKDLMMLLGLLGLMPAFLVRWFVAFLEWGAGRLGGFVRFLRIGIKGLIVTLYYSGETGEGYSGRSSHDVLGYKVFVYTQDLE